MPKPSRIRYKLKRRPPSVGLEVSLDYLEIKRVMEIHHLSDITPHQLAGFRSLDTEAAMRRLQNLHKLGLMRQATDGAWESDKPVGTGPEEDLLMHCALENIRLVADDEKRTVAEKHKSLRLLKRYVERLISEL